MILKYTICVFIMFNFFTMKFNYISGDQVDDLIIKVNSYIDYVTNIKFTCMSEIGKLQSSVYANVDKINVECLKQLYELVSGKYDCLDKYVNEAKEAGKVNEKAIEKCAAFVRSKLIDINQYAEQRILQCYRKAKEMNDNQIKEFNVAISVGTELATELTDILSNCENGEISEIENCLYSRMNKINYSVVNYDRNVSTIQDNSWELPQQVAEFQMNCSNNFISGIHTLNIESEIAECL